jgi:hypothetical protein
VADRASSGEPDSEKPSGEPDIEQPLTGGNTHGVVVRVGDTVRRPAGSWTPAVHRLLAALAEAGFGAAPRALGLDEQGREVLSFVPGRVVWPEHPGLVGSDEALAELRG